MSDLLKEDKYILLLSYDLQFFAKEGPGGEKTEEPTSKRLDDARKKGQVAKSKEIGSAASLLTFFVMLNFLLAWLRVGFQEYFAETYNAIPNAARMYDGAFPRNNISLIVNRMILKMFLYMGPFLVVGLVVAIVTGVAQVGWKPTAEPMKPTFSKMNPISGLKKIISKESLFNLGIAILKVALISLVVYNYLLGREESIFLLYDIPLAQAIVMMGDIVVQMGLRIAAIYMVIAVIDFVYQKRKFHEDMKMTKQEVKDEMKDDEGDPQIKAKQRQRMREASQRRMMQELPKADVVITNPTHFAVAIRYEALENPAPVVLAKGADFLAERIKKTAKENDIEIVENKALARMLYANVEIGEMIPPELYKAVAEVLAFVYHLKGKA